jgi:hypothetical protein
MSGERGRARLSARIALVVAFASAASAPCKLVETPDANGEAHFFCPCATCQ